MKTQLEGRFKFQVTRPDGTSRVISDWSPNLILDAGLNRIGSGGFMGFCMVGGSSSAPSNGQTALITKYADTSDILTDSVGVELTSNYCYIRRTYRFAAGVAAGNLSEVGVGWTSTLCFSRALIVDMGGIPTTITVLSDEILDVTYEFRMYWPLSDGTAMLTVNELPYDIVSRASNVGDWHLAMLQWFVTNGSNDINSFYFNVDAYSGGVPADLGAITVGPSMSGSGSGPLSYGSAYVNNSYERSYVGYFIPTPVILPITAVKFTTVLGIYKLSIDPAIPKDNTNTFSVNVKCQWARRVI